MIIYRCQSLIGISVQNLTVNNAVCEKNSSNF